MKIIKKVLLGILVAMALIIALGIGMAASETPKKAETEITEVAAESKLNECAEDVAAHFSEELGMEIDGWANDEDTLCIWVSMPYDKNTIKTESADTYNNAWQNIAEYTGDYCLDNGVIAKEIIVYYSGTESNTDWVIKSTNDGTQFAED